MSSNTVGTYSAVLNETDLAGFNFPATSTDLSIIALPVSSYTAFSITTPWTLTLFDYSIPHAASGTFETTFSSQLGGSFPTQIPLIPTFLYVDVSASITTGTTSIPGTNNASINTESTTIFTQTNTKTGSTIILTLVQSDSPTTPTTPISDATASSTNAAITTSSQSSSGAPITSVGPSNDLSTHSTLSTGAKVGIAVGCVLGALLVVSVLAFVCLRRRKRNGCSNQPYRGVPRASKANGESVKLAAATVTTRPMHLPQPESDQTIARLVNRTLDDIELFVENYYVDQPTKLAGEINASAMLPFSSPYLGGLVADAVRSSSEPTIIFKHCIAYYLLQKIDPTRNNTFSLLPRHFVVPTKGDPKAISRRRVEAAHSRKNIAVDQDYLLQRDRAIQNIVQQIEHAFRPWTRGTAEQRAKSFSGILTHLSELGQKLFAQPADFEWRWRTPSRDEIAILPGLSKVTNSEAVMLATSISLVEPRLGSVW